MNDNYFVIGIDSGSSGAISALHVQNNFISVHASIYTPMKPDGENEEVDVLAVLDFIKNLPAPIKMICIERAGFIQGDGARAYATVKLVGYFRELYGALQTLGVPVIKVNCRKWQNYLLGQLPKNLGSKEVRRKELKRRSIQLCSYLYRDFNIIDPGKRVANDAKTDSILIAHYGIKDELQI